MKVLTYIVFAGLAALFAGACSSAGNAPSGPSAAATPAQAATHAAPDEDTPANVRAAFPDAQTFAKQHKDITPAQKTAIEKESGGAVSEADHHSYLAFATAGGARKQIGAATVVKAGGKEAVIIYESREGQPFIKEVRVEGVAPEFLAQFKGKGHHDKLDAKPNGLDATTAKALTTAIAVDFQTMQTLYGGSHTH